MKRSDTTWMIFLFLAGITVGCAHVGIEVNIDPFVWVLPFAGAIITGYYLRKLFRSDELDEAAMRCLQRWRKRGASK